MRGKLSKVVDTVKQSWLWTTVASFFLLLFGISGTMFAALGLCIFCVLPALTFVLSIFGLSVAAITEHSYLFLIFGLASLGLSIYLWVRRKKLCKTCQAPPVKKKK